MDVELDKSVRYIKGVGEGREKLMNKLGIRTLRELVGYFPRAYEDRTVFKEINSLSIGETVCVRAMAAAAPSLSRVRSGLDLVKLRAADDTGLLDVTFFNQAYIKDAIKQGETYIFYGKVTGTLLKPAMTNPLFERDSGAGEAASASASAGKIVPVYAATAGLPQNHIRAAVRRGLDECGGMLPETLPDEVSRKHELCRAQYAYENIHFPADMKALEIARKRLIFEELFVLAAAMKRLRASRVEKTGRSIGTHDLGGFFSMLPFEPTGAQKRAILDAAGDMARQTPMNRLVQGDVGSGKTLVAAACCWLAQRAGRQSAFMAPTEILAKQHYDTLAALLEPAGLRVGLLTGGMRAKQKREAYEGLKNGGIDLMIGTHALLSEGVGFADLALVIADEQHRFGVSQRSVLTEKGDSPHVLVMSATPIPRTLALMIYGDLDVSVIDEMPPGRQEIETHVVTEKHRQRMYGFVRKLAAEGQQIYIICPMVEEGEDPVSENEVKSARRYHEMIQREVFPDLRVALVHGKMASKEKDAAMGAFAAGETDILVATTVVEVGVDVPNAAMIVVENADRFGLSQLHQLRGRVGRGEHKSYCILFQSAGSALNDRLGIMRATSDGFKIAEEDLKLRGPGDFFGSRQHGLPELRIANFATDMLVLNQAQNAAEEVLRKDPMLTSPDNAQLAAQIEHMFELNADRLN